MTLLGTTHAAGRAGVSPGRLRALLRAGVVHARQIEGRWVVDDADLDLWLTKRAGARTTAASAHSTATSHQGASPETAPPTAMLRRGFGTAGRPLSARSAWAILGFGGRHLSRSETARARARRECLAFMAPGVLSRRARALRGYCHPGLWQALSADPQVSLGGVRAGILHGADLAHHDQDPLEVYVAAGDLDAVIARYGIHMAITPRESNLTVHVPNPWPPGLERGCVVPAAVAIADMIDSCEPRADTAARQLALPLLAGTPTRGKAGDDTRPDFTGY